MSQAISKSAMLKSFSFALLFVTSLTYSAVAGRDSYEIYLNNKLIQKQYVGESTAGLTGLQLDKSNYNDKLVVYYIHCNTKGPGKGRNISVKNAQNQILKEWKFADVSGTDASMSIPVKDILALQKDNPNAVLSLCYVSTQELPAGQVLASIKLGDKSVSYNQDTKKIVPALYAWVAEWMNIKQTVSGRNLV